MELFENSVDLLNLEIDVADVAFLVVKFLSGFISRFTEFVNAPGVAEHLTLNIFCFFVQVLDLFHEIIKRLAVNCCSI